MTQCIFPVLETLTEKDSQFWKINLIRGVSFEETWMTNECEVMQFTGELDCKGKEISEGDIVRIRNVFKKERLYEHNT